MRHILESIPKFTDGGDDNGIPDGQAVAPKEVNVGPLVVEGRTSRLVKNMVACELSTINRGFVSYFLTQPDEAVTLLSPGKTAVWCTFFAFRH